MNSPKGNWDLSISPLLFEGRETRFNHSVALLHSFQYEEEEAPLSRFRQGSDVCDGAWGGHVALSWVVGERRHRRRPRGSAQREGPSRVETKTTAREQAYLEPWRKSTRKTVKTRTPRRSLRAKDGGPAGGLPDDLEAAIFHALALGITAPKEDKAFANQRKCGEILEPFFEKLPNHPAWRTTLLLYDNRRWRSRDSKRRGPMPRSRQLPLTPTHAIHIFTRVVRGRVRDMSTPRRGKSSH